jgi:hypothetical protein
MNDYQTAKTAVLEAFSQHAKPGQKIEINGDKFHITKANTNFLDYGSYQFGKLVELTKIRKACFLMR